MSTLSPTPAPRLRVKVKHIISSTMLCCGRRKETRESVETQTEGPSSVRRGVAGPSRVRMPEMVVQGDFRKVSGISTEIFRQIEAVENDFDASTAAHFEAVERRGEMIIRLLDPCSLGRAGAETCKRYLAVADTSHVVQFVEIIKRPGQTLGLYIREGDGMRCLDGVFISRIALESAVYNSGLLKVGDEILAVNLVDVRHMSLDDVVIIMSIPRRLVMTIRSKVCGAGRSALRKAMSAEESRPPVVVIKKEVEELDGPEEVNSNSENGQLLRARTKGLPSDMPLVAVPLEHHQLHQIQSHHQMGHLPGGGDLHEDQYLFYNSQPPPHSRLREETPWYAAPPDVPVTRQPKGPPQRFPKTLEILAEQVHSFYGGPQPPPSPLDARKMPHTLAYSRPERSSTARHRYWDEHGSALRRPSGAGARLPRAESEQKIPLSGMDAAPTYERYSARGLRPGLRASTMQARGRARRYEDLPPHVGILRRRPVMESASDTEATGPGRDSWLRQRSFSRPRAQSRSNSLPRARVSDHDYRRHRQSVRFERSTLPYDSQEDSDGAVSAPELPATRTGRRGFSGYRPTSNVFTSAEYRAWMSRAPSTSAIYEKVRRGRRFPQGVQTLPRIAHSVESLLDSFRQEQQHSLLLPGDLRHSLLSSSRGVVTGGGSERSYPFDFRRVQVPHPTPVKPSEDRLHLLTLNPREFFKYKPERESETVLHSDGFSGLLWVHLLAGRGLRPTSHGDHFRDLYCVIECDRVHKARTVVRTGEHSFDWDEVFELDVVDTSEMSFLLYSWDPQFRHKLCYKGTIHLLTILRESPVHSVALKLEPRGTLYLKLRYRDPRQTFQRLPPATATVGVFGTDLETVVLRENSPTGVPLLVRRCCEEVEKRGLNIVAIYRLCGSAVRKKTLRESLERNPTGDLDLSSDHVPDINVVTSLLKDYLRELREPLFTKGLFDMLVDGLSVCLPDDPEGNAKLMFSILECLPRINRCTVMYLMDHLKLVSSHSDRNKMSPEQLAVCFGPPLMCHTETGAPVADLHKPIQVFKYLLEIWPLNRTAPGSGSSESSNNDHAHQGPSGLQPGPSGTQPSAAVSTGQVGGSLATGTSEEVKSTGAVPKKSVAWVGQQILPESSC